MLLTKASPIIAVKNISPFTFNLTLIGSLQVSAIFRVYYALVSIFQTLVDILRNNNIDNW